MVVFNITLSFVFLGGVAVINLELPNLCFLNGRIVGEKRFAYLEYFLVGTAEYFFRVGAFAVVVVAGVDVVVVVVDVRDSLYYMIKTEKYMKIYIFLYELVYITKYLLE